MHTLTFRLDVAVASSNRAASSPLHFQKGYQYFISLIALHCYTSQVYILCQWTLQH